jgi:hypothetical protein
VPLDPAEQTKEVPLDPAEQTKEVPLDPASPEGKALRVSSTLNPK